MKNYLANKMNAVREGMKDNKGFSLVELIIVVAIMAVLMGILAPQYLRFVESSREQSDASAVNEVSKAMTIAMATAEDVDAGFNIKVEADGDLVFNDGTAAYVTGKTSADAGYNKFFEEVAATVGTSLPALSSDWASKNEPTLTVAYSNGLYYVYCATANGNDHSTVDTWATRLSLPTL